MNSIISLGSRPGLESWSGIEYQNLEIMILNRVFSMEIYSEVLPITLGVPFLKPRYSKNDLWTREMNNHEFNHVREGSRGKQNDRSPKNSSLVIWSSVYIVSGDG